MDPEGTVTLELWKSKDGGGWSVREHGEKRFLIAYSKAAHHHLRLTDEKGNQTAEVKSKICTFHSQWTGSTGNGEGESKQKMEFSIYPGDYKDIIHVSIEGTVLRILTDSTDSSRSIYKDGCVIAKAFPNPHQNDDGSVYMVEVLHPEQVGSGFVCLLMATVDFMSHPSAIKRFASAAVGTALSIGCQVTAAVTATVVADELLPGGN